jgi:cell division septation protein DedD
LEAHEHEPSYYEVALTNRQVVSGFVILLVCLFAAFLSGVWLGREANAGSVQIAAAAPVRAPEAGEAKLEQLTFFGDRGAVPAARPVSPAPTSVAPAAAPRPTERAAPTPAEAEAEKLRQTLEAEMAQHRTDLEAASPAEATAPPAVAPVGTRLKRKGERSGASAATAAPTAAAPTTAAPTAAAPVAAAAAPTAAAPAGAPIWIQVYSSSNGAKAQELAARLRQGSFQVAVLEAVSGGGATFRVRVGPYTTRDAADRAASRLRREYRLDTWVTDQP